MEKNSPENFHPFPKKTHWTARIVRCFGFLMDQGRIILNLHQIPFQNHCIYGIIVQILDIQSLLSCASASWNSQRWGTPLWTWNFPMEFFLLSFLYSLSPFFFFFFTLFNTFFFLWENFYTSFFFKFFFTWFIQIWIEFRCLKVWGAKIIWFFFQDWKKKNWERMEFAEERSDQIQDCLVFKAVGYLGSFSSVYVWERKTYFLKK